MFSVLEYVSGQFGNLGRLVLVTSTADDIFTGYLHHRDENRKQVLAINVEARTPKN
jgi:hypothetical protein